MTTATDTGVTVRDGEYAGRKGTLVSQAGTRATVRLGADESTKADAIVVTLPLKMLDLDILARSFLSVYRSGPAYA